MYHLSAQSLYQCSVLRFGVAYDYVVVRDKEHICNLPLCRKGFAASGCAEYHAVWILEIFSIHHNKVV